MNNLTEHQIEDNSESLNTNRFLPDADDVNDIEYYISPNCKIIRFDCWDEALHFHSALHAQKEIP